MTIQDKELEGREEREEQDWLLPELPGLPVSSQRNFNVRFGMNGGRGRPRSQGRPRFPVEAQASTRSFSIFRLPMMNSCRSGVFLPMKNDSSSSLLCR